MIESFIGVWFLVIIISDIVTPEPEKEIPTLIDSKTRKRAVTYTRKGISRDKTMVTVNIHRWIIWSRIVSVFVYDE